MEDLSGDDHAPDPGGGFTGFLTSLRGVIATLTTLVVAISGLIGALKATGVIGGDDGPPVKTQTDADSGPFRPVKRTNGRVYFEGGTMFVTATKPGKPLLHLVEGEEERGDVALSLRAERVSGAYDWGISFVCRYQNAANYYLLAVLSNGGYNIVRYRNGKRTFLKRGPPRGDESEAPKAIEARCLGAKPTVLSLSVGGHPLGRAEDDDPIERGTVGIRLGSSESRVTCSFDDIVLR